MKRLVLIGSASMSVPDRPDVLRLDGLSDEESCAGLAAANMLVVPSTRDFAATAALRAWLAGTPVLADERNFALAALIEMTGAGATYAHTEDFIQGLNRLIAQGRDITQRGQDFVRRECTWEAVGDRLGRLVAGIGA
jgi:hypothetical protein